METVGGFDSQSSLSVYFGVVPSERKFRWLRVVGNDYLHETAMFDPSIDNHLSTNLRNRKTVNLVSKCCNTSRTYCLCHWISGLNISKASMKKRDAYLIHQIPSLFHRFNKSARIATSLTKNQTKEKAVGRRETPTTPSRRPCFCYAELHKARRRCRFSVVTCCEEAAR